METVCYSPPVKEVVDQTASANGSISVRLPRSVHAALLAEAKEEGVSLNQLGVSKLVAQLRAVVEVPALTGGPQRHLRGPGIAERATIAVAGLAESFWSEWKANHALFPCGVDVVFTAGRALLALPRSIIVEG